MADVNCETDFVAKGDDFIGFASDVVNSLLTSNVSNDEELQAMVLSTGIPVDDTRRAMVAKIGENITVRRFMKYTTETGGVASYLHGSKIAVIVELEKADAELGKDLAMHIAASKPACISAEQVSAESIEKEKEIFLAQQEEKIKGKPADIVEKMVSGRINKFLAEITLLGQAFIKDDSKSVAQLLKEKGNAVIRFDRFEVGEGIEKKEEDFAAEVMAQVRGS
jgi:elongation factor Ts